MVNWKSKYLKYKLKYKKLKGGMEDTFEQEKQLSEKVNQEVKNIYIKNIEEKFDKINEDLGTEWLVEYLKTSKELITDYQAKTKVLSYLKSENGWQTSNIDIEQLMDLTGLNHKTYNKTYKRYNEIPIPSIILNELSKFEKPYNEWFAQVWTTLIDKIPIDFFIEKRDKPLKILDAGSAAGAFLYPIKQALYSEYKIEVDIDGVDLSSECIGFANIAKVGGHDNWKIGNIFDLKNCFIPRFDENDKLNIVKHSIEDDTYDIVISNGVFLCLDYSKQLQAFNECMRITKPNGYLLIGRNNNSDVLIKDRQHELISWEYAHLRGGTQWRLGVDPEQGKQGVNSFFSAVYYQFPCPDWNQIIEKSNYKNTENLGISQCSDLWTGDVTFIDNNYILANFYPRIGPWEKLIQDNNYYSNGTLKQIIEKKINDLKPYIQDVVSQLRNNITFIKKL